MDPKQSNTGNISKSAFLASQIDWHQEDYRCATSGTCAVAAIKRMALAVGLLAFSFVLSAQISARFVPYIASAIAHKWLDTFTN